MSYPERDENDQYLGCAPCVDNDQEYEEFRFSHVWRAAGLLKDDSTSHTGRMFADHRRIDKACAFIQETLMSLDHDAKRELARRVLKVIGHHSIISMDHSVDSEIHTKVLSCKCGCKEFTFSPGSPLCKECGEPLYTKDQATFLFSMYDELAKNSNAS